MRAEEMVVDGMGVTGEVFLRTSLLGEAVYGSNKLFCHLRVLPGWSTREIVDISLRRPAPHLTRLGEVSLVSLSVSHGTGAKLRTLRRGQVASLKRGSTRACINLRMMSRLICLSPEALTLQQLQARAMQVKKVFRCRATRTGVCCFCPIFRAKPGPSDHAYGNGKQRDMATSSRLRALNGLCHETPRLPATGCDPKGLCPPAGDSVAAM